MPATLHYPTAADVRSGQVLTYDKLRLEAVAAADSFEGLNQDLAEELGVSIYSLSRALNKSGGRYAKLQKRVIEHVRPHYVLEEVGGWQVNRSGGEQ